MNNFSYIHSKDKSKNVNIAKQLEDIRLKRDPILKLSEEFAYKNRKPLFSLFNYGKNDKENVYMMDCGCGYADGRLACLCLDDMRSIYE